MNRISRSDERLIVNPVFISFAVFVGCVLFVSGFSLGLGFYAKREFWEGLLVEAHGMLFDILIIGILVLWLNLKGEKLREIQRYKNEIDDFREWKSEEAMYRIVGNIKRLNKLGITEIPLHNCYLKGATLRFLNLSKAQLNGANFVDADLVGTNLQHAIIDMADFSNANLMEANFFVEYFLEAKFDGAFYDEKTILSPQINPQEDGMIKIIRDV